MSIHVAISHRTTYRYDKLVQMGPQIVRLKPAAHCRTRILSYSLKVSPEDHWINWQQDAFGNYLARIVFPERTDHFQVAVDLIAEATAINPFDFFVEEKAEEYPFRYDPHEKKDLAPYLEVMDDGPRLEAYMATVPRGPMNTIDYVVELNRKLSTEINYLIRMEPGVQKPDHTLERGSGSCRDSGWLLVQILRKLGLAARFCSGYLFQLRSDEKSLDGPSGPEADFTDLHAWAEVYLPGAGWVGLDPTSGLLASEGHLPLACTPAPISAAPITGMHEPAEVEFEFDMEVRRVYEAPRVTLPFDDKEWNKVNALGEMIDRRLEASDVRLTMGGEPTFVGLDDRDADEWNTEAVGPTKRGFADTLIRRLRDRFAPKGLLQYGQGKWYPGEQLPRWAFALYWRTDEEPLWHDQGLIGSETAPANPTAAEAQRFVEVLCDTLEIDAENALPAFEDPVHFMHKEQNLPPNVDPLDNRLEDPEERSRMIRVFERGLNQPAGYVLPLQAWQARAHGSQRRFRWRSEKWVTRRGRIFLMPGDSPVGFRLPLGNLPYIQQRHYPRVFPMDPFAGRPRLPVSQVLFQGGNGPVAPGTGSNGGGNGYGAYGQADSFGEWQGNGVPPEIDWAEYETWPYDFEDVPFGAPLVSAVGAVRTALAVEPRNGHLCVFLPPTHSADEYVDLVNAVEETAAALGMPVHVEGYPPPTDPRLREIKVTPDPGVIEVNIHPASSWAEQVAITEGLYEEARTIRLDTQKFMLDGRPSGTGGGNHIVLGGPTAGDSPFLRRPDLLGSIVRYWQNHPSLSYLFSGMFIGPTSQAPRFDEARQEVLYEMEIALSKLPMPDGASGFETPPWLIDRIMRNLLVDVTGNTHRAEICIDKLYNPEGASGRLGLVEFRGFEMPPHARMSLAQQLLLRALIAWFWDKPYTRPLIKHGTALHDKFMLPDYIWADFMEILDDLKEAGMPFEPSWFLPQFEFRFPRFGAVEVAGVELELRAALEPWHVLGEQGTVGGTARYVDSSVERLQLRLSGSLAGRYRVTCNGITLPLKPTDRLDTQVAGVRFRAWWPPECLHPTVGIHTPLVFDIVDLWNRRSIGGCTYHVKHPGGRGYDIAPVNALEAEGRRLSRFEPGGHRIGAMAPGPAAVNDQYPYTLDLRLYS